MVTDHSHTVRSFFAEPDRYLGSDVGLRTRALVCGSMVQGTDRSRILDVGCGDGSMSLPLLTPHGHLTLLDFSPQMLERASANIPGPLRPNVEIVTGDLMGFAPDEPASLVLCLGVLAHVPDVSAALTKLASLVKPGGHCLLQITDASRWLGRLNHAYYDWQSGSRAADAYLLNRLESQSLIASADAVGLRLVASRSYSLAFPGSGRLPRRLRFSVEVRFLRSRLARFGGETLLLFRRA